MLEVYRAFAEDILAMPVIAGEKPENERFPGAMNTYSIEAMMQDGKALQAGTSHFLGTHFAEAQNIRFQNDAGGMDFCHTTSWGVSTRLIGALVPAKYELNRFSEAQRGRSVTTVSIVALRLSRSTAAKCRSRQPDQRAARDALTSLVRGGWLSRDASGC